MHADESRGPMKYGPLPCEVVSIARRDKRIRNLTQQDAMVGDGRPLFWREWQLASITDTKLLDPRLKWNLKVSGDSQTTSAHDSPQYSGIQAEMMDDVSSRRYYMNLGLPWP